VIVHLGADIVIKRSEDVEVILDGLDQEDINSIVQKWREITEVRKKLDQLEEMLKMKVRAYLKERSWTRYVDPLTRISVTLTTQRREDFDRVQLKLMLTEAQYAQVLKTTTFEKLMIVTPETRERLKKYVMAKTK
jgi:hypothetical protein